MRSEKREKIKEMLNYSINSSFKYSMASLVFASLACKSTLKTNSVCSNLE